VYTFAQATRRSRVARGENSLKSGWGKLVVRTMKRNPYVEEGKDEMSRKVSLEVTWREQGMRRGRGENQDLIHRIERRSQTSKPSRAYHHSVRAGHLPARFGDFAPEEDGALCRVTIGRQSGKRADDNTSRMMKSIIFMTWPGKVLAALLGDKNPEMSENLISK